MTQTMEALREQQKKTNQAIGRMENEKRRAENAPMVGKMFRYRNSYSCPEKPSDYWMLYAKVISMDSAGYLQVFTFETCKYGHINIRTDESRFHMNDGYQLIRKPEYDRALKALKSKISKF